MWPFAQKWFPGVGFCVILLVVVSSSSGPGRLVLIQEIAGSTPAGTTKISGQPITPVKLRFSGAVLL